MTVSSKIWVWIWNLNLVSAIPFSSDQSTHKNRHPQLQWQHPPKYEFEFEIQISAIPFSSGQSAHVLQQLRCTEYVFEIEIWNSRYTVVVWPISAAVLPSTVAHLSKHNDWSQEAAPLHSYVSISIFNFNSTAIEQCRVNKLTFQFHTSKFNS